MATWSVLAAAVAAVTQVQGATMTWDGGPSGTGTAWNVAANWSGDVIPGSSDTVQFTSTGLPANTVISLGSSQSIREFRINSFSNVPNFTVGSAADISAGNTLTLLNVYRGDNNSNTQTLASRIKLAGDSTWNIINGFNNSVAVTGNIVSDSAVTLIKEGSNTLTVNGANTFSGGVRVVGGGLSLGGTNTYTGSTAATGGSVTLNFNAGTAPTTNIVSTSSTLALGGIRGGGSLTANGKNLANAVNSQTFNGLSLGAGSSSLSIVNGIASGKTLVALGNISRTIGSNVNFTQPTVNATISAQNGYTTGTANDASDILGGYATVGGTDWATNNGTNIIAYTNYSTLSGASPTLTNSATANVNVTSSSTLDIGQGSGTTTVNTIRVSDAAARTITVGAGNTLRLGAVGGVLTPTGTGVLTIGASGNAGTLTAGGADSVAGEVIFTNATAVTVNSVIANNNTSLVTLVKAGAGTLTLGATNTFTGGTFVNAGTLALTAGSTDQLSTTGAITLAGGTLNLGASTNQTTSGDVALLGGTLSNGTLTKSGTNYDLRNGTISTKLAGGVGINKTTSGTVSLSNTVANTFTGDTTITEGALIGGVGGNVVSVNGNLIIGSVNGINAASYANSGSNNGFNSARNVTVYSNGSANFGGGAQNLNGSITILGGSITGTQIYQNSTVNMTGGSWGGTTYGNVNSFTTSASSDMATVSASLQSAQATKTFTIADGDAVVDLLLSGNISSGAMTKAGVGVMESRGDKAYTGITTVSGGTLRVTTLAANGVASSIGAGAVAASNLLLANGTTLQYVGAGNTTNRLFTINGTAAGHGATLDASGSGAAVFNGSGNIAFGTTNQTRTFNLTGTSTADNTLGLNINNNGTTTNAVSVNKTGAGKWILSGSNGYTGGTSVTDGTLLINGTLGNTAVTVNGANAVLGGSNGVIGGNVTITDGTLAAGASIGQLTFGGDLTINDTLLVELDGTLSGSADTILVQGAGKTLDITNATVDFSVLATLDDAAYIFAKYTTLQGTFAPSNILNLPSGYELQYNYLGQNQIAVAAVPEPATLSLLMLGAVGLMSRRRSRA